MDQIVKTLRNDYAHFRFISGKVATWSPIDHTIVYTSEDSTEAIWALFHELGHALLDHTSYTSDTVLLQKETAAWEKAIALAKAYGHSIDSDHVQDCLDTYRDWLHKRSTCPACNMHGLQTSESLYSCLNCQSTWKVGSDRFCRPYRLKRV